MYSRLQEGLFFRFPLPVHQVHELLHPVIPAGCGYFIHLTGAQAVKVHFHKPINIGYKYPLIQLNAFR